MEYLQLIFGLTIFFIALLMLYLLIKFAFNMYRLRSLRKEFPEESTDRLLMMFFGIK